MATKKKRARPSGPKRRARRSSPRVPVLEQRHFDVIGLGLVALGVFMGLVLYRGWEGGRAGGAIADGLAWTLGEVRYAAPVALAAIGGLLIARPVLPAARPIRAGGLCLLGAATLGLAAGTLGIGPGATHTEAWSQAALAPRGGALGQALFWSSGSLFSVAGAHILAVFLFLAGVLLITGASVAGVLKATGGHVADTTRSLRRPAPAIPDALLPPDFLDSEPLISDARVDEVAPTDGPDAEAATGCAGFWRGDERYPDLFGDDALEPTDDESHGEELEDQPDSEPAVGAEGLREEDPTGADIPAIVVTQEQLTPQGRYRAAITDDPEFVWHLPPSRLLKRSTAEQARPDTAGQERAGKRLVEALGHFGVRAQIIGAVAGPHITRYELRLAPGIKMSKVAQLKDDLAYALAATDIRILAPIPGKTAVGVEVPNARRKNVQLGDVWQDAPADWSPLAVWLGKDVSGRAIGADLAKMPHLLVAGTTGAGKSGAINAMLSSLLLNATPHELRLVLVDPKQVELNHYDAIPHLLTPVITSPRMAANALQNLVKEMESRYSTMSLARTRSLPELNRVRDKRGEAQLPYILCVIDELADLMMVAPADVEDSIIRLAQKARAVGIHLVLATQSPRVDVITGMIKANVPSRIAFAVSSQTDSRVILDCNGAESLLGKGDMLYSPVGSSRLQRIQGAYIDEAQIERLTDFWRKQGEPEMREDLLEQIEPDVPAESGPDDFDPDEDPLLEDAIRLVAEMGTASTSMLQRRMRLGYTRAGRLIDMLERRNVISGYEGSKPRQVLVGPADAERFIAAIREGTPTPQDASRVPVPDDE